MHQATDKTESGNVEKSVKYSMVVEATYGWGITVFFAQLKQEW